MHVELPDPYPGRCRNHRTVVVDGHPEVLRCLDLDGRRHVCRFPDPVRRPVSGGFVTTGEPKPWTPPDEVGGGA